jgi:hypothetical protein
LVQRVLEELDLADDEADRSLLLDEPASVLTRVGRRCFRARRHRRCR